MLRLTGGGGDRYAPVKRYRIVVKGSISPRYGFAFDGLELEAKPGQTELKGVFVDQSQL